MSLVNSFYWAMKTTLKQIGKIGMKGRRMSSRDAVLHMTYGSYMGILLSLDFTVAAVRGNQKAS